MCDISIAINIFNRYNADRNKTALPAAPQLYKNQKFWSPQHHLINSTALRLKELFQKQIRQIWKVWSQ